MLLRRLSIALAIALSLQNAARADSADMGTYPIVDPVFDMPAYTLLAPSDWNVTGTVLPGASCESATPIVYKATSRDGSTGAELIPHTVWAWGPGINAKSDCQLADHPISAKDFLTYYMRHSKVGFVKDVPIPDERKMTPLHPGETDDQSSALVRYSVGDGKAMEAILEDSVICSAYTTMGVGEYHMCFAQISRKYAPLGKLDAMLPAFRSMKLTLNQAWMSAWTNAMRTRLSGLYASQTKTLLAQGELAGAQRMQAHQDYMTSMQQGADRRNIQFAAGQYRKQNNNDNYVDFILDCQRSYSGGTRISSSNCPNRQTF